jgi:hypothetical protein
VLNIEMNWGDTDWLEVVMNVAGWYYRIFEICYQIFKQMMATMTMVMMKIMMMATKTITSSEPRSLDNLPTTALGTAAVPDCCHFARFRSRTVAKNVNCCPLHVE